MAEEFKNIIDTSYDKGITPFWIYTTDYIYGMVPADANGDCWIEVAQTFEDPDEPLIKSEKGADLAYQLMMEEIGKGLTFYVEDLKVPQLKAFADGTGKSGSDLIAAVVNELISNTASYSGKADFLIKSKDDLGKLKEKV